MLLLLGENYQKCWARILKARLIIIFATSIPGRKHYRFILIWDNIAKLTFQTSNHTILWSTLFFGANYTVLRYSFNASFEVTLQ